MAEIPISRCPVCGCVVDGSKRVYCGLAHKMRAYRLRRATKRNRIQALGDKTKVVSIITYVIS